MASLRKKYQPQFESPSRDDGPPVLPPPVTGAKMPEPAADAGPPPELPETESPADRAAQAKIQGELSELQKRHLEMHRAEQFARQQQQPPQHAEQQEPKQPAMPAHVQEWLSRHPQYMDPNNRIALLEINLATEKCLRDGLTWNDDNFIPSIERHL